MIAPVASAVTSIFGPVAPSSLAGSPEASGGFTGVLKSALNQVSGLQQDASTQVNGLLAGGNVDISKVTIASEKADVAFQLMMQVRNKVVAAYQDIEKAQF